MGKLCQVSPDSTQYIEPWIYILTPMTEEALKVSNKGAEWSADNMINRLSTIDEMMVPILFLLSDASSIMAAANLVMDGGHTSW